MYIVMGATGHVGGGVARALLDAHKPVTVITRDASKAAALRRRGAVVAELRLRDVEALRAAFKRARRAFVLVPQAPPSTDTDREERANVQAILQALDGSGLERVVADSTYGAQRGERIGDLSVLYGLEQGLRAQPIPTTILRGAYYFKNFDGLLEPARAGVLPTMIPADKRMPMVAPADIGRVAADWLMAPATSIEPVNVEGPARHTHHDVAQAFARALGRDVKALDTPRARWEPTFRQLGFSPEAARTYTNMVAASVDQRYAWPSDPTRGSTTLQAYIDRLVAQACVPASCQPPTSSGIWSASAGPQLPFSYG